MRKKLKTSANDRECAFMGCKQILSIYNHEKYCHVHHDRMAEKKRFDGPYHHFIETR
jgi:hypothetical protein